VTEPTESEMTEFWLRICRVIDWGLRSGAAEYGAEKALVMAQLFDDGRWRLMTELDLDADQKPIPGSLDFRIDVQSPVTGEWAEFALIKASALGVSPEQEAAEARWTALQNGHGVPDDLAGLDGDS
jgi:hypothetical protein